MTAAAHARRSPATRPAWSSLPNLLAMVPALLVLVLWAVWAAGSGGYFDDDWYPAAFGLLALLAIVVVAGWRPPRARTARIALGLFAGLVAWSYLSILWAESQGDALEGANHLALVFSGVTVLAVTPWTEGRAAAFFGGWSLISLAATGLALAGAAHAADPSASFIEGRYADPLGYAGASGSLAALGVWPALTLSLRRSSPRALQGVMLGLATVLAELSVLPQSRGAVIGLLLGFVVFLAFAPDRGRALSRIAILGVVAAPTVGKVFDVYFAAREGRPVPPALDSALEAIVLAFVLAGLLGFGQAMLERRLIPSPERARLMRHAAVAAIAGVVVLALAGAATQAGSISSSASDSWHAFKTGDDTSGSAKSRLTSTGDPERFDYWRVGLDVTTGAPILGVGSGNYQVEYTKRRHEQKHSRYSHDIWLTFSSETGLVGLLLLIGMIATGFARLVVLRRWPGAGGWAIVAGGAATAAAFLAHASVDWVDEFPLLAMAGFGLIFVAMRACEPLSSSKARKLGGLGLAVCVLSAVTVVALTPAYLGLRYTERAERGWRSDPTRAYRDLDRAASANPLSAQPRVTAGDIAVQLRDDSRARASFRAALAREDSWYPHFELSLLASKHAQFALAQREMQRAKALNPPDLLIADVAPLVAKRERLDPRDIDGLVRRQAREQFYKLR